MTHFVDGSWVKGTGSFFITKSPVDGSILFKKKQADNHLIKKAAESAKKAFESWGHTSFDERIERLLTFKKLLSEEKEAFAAVISKETGKPLWESTQETASMIEKISISQAAFRQRCRVTEISVNETHIRTHYRPHGALGVLGPFNFPGHLPNGHIIPALMAGNTIVYKPSEKTPLTGEFYTALMEKAKIPPGVFNLIQGGKECGELIAKSPQLDGLLFTGSHLAGSALLKIFSDQAGKILALEMGGNNPLIIEEVSDIMAACFITIQSAFISTGQRCSCARRLILQKSFAPKFLPVLIEKIKALKIGIPSENPYMGPLITQSARDNVLAMQDKLMALGGTSLLRLEPFGNKGAFITPGLIDVTQVKKRPDEECFGPLLQVIIVHDFQEALEEANNTQFGLTASIVTEKRHHFELFQKKIKAGIVNWNAPTTGASSKSAFGGLKESGNLRPSAFFAADYCSSPIASMECERLSLPKTLPPGISI